MCDFRCSLQSLINTDDLLTIFGSGFVAGFAHLLLHSTLISFELISRWIKSAPFLSNGQLLMSTYLSLVSFRISQIPSFPILFSPNSVDIYQSRTPPNWWVGLEPILPPLRYWSYLHKLIATMIESSQVAHGWYPSSTAIPDIIPTFLKHKFTKIQDL